MIAAVGSTRDGGYIHAATKRTNNKQAHSMDLTDREVLSCFAESLDKGEAAMHQFVGALYDRKSIL